MATATTQEHRATRRPLSPFAEWSDERLLREYRDTRKQSLFATLVHRYEQEMFNYLRHYLGDVQLAEDTFQTTFFHVHLKCDQFDPARKFRPWLYKIATNRAIDNLRRCRRRAAVSLDTPCDPRDPDSGTWVNWLPGDCQDPVSQLIQHENRLVTRSALNGLPRHLQQVIVLVFFQGMKYREAAEVLDLPVGTVKSRMHTAISRLREIVTEQ